MERKHAFSALLVACVLVAIAAGMYFTAGGRPSDQGGVAGGEEEKNVKAYFFYSDHCPHCAKVKPIVKTWAKELNTVFCCVDEELDEECLKVAEENGVYAVPTLIVYESGNATQLVGSDEIEQYLEQRFGGVSGESGESS